MDTIQSKDKSDIPIYGRSGIGQPGTGYCILQAGTTMINIDLETEAVNLGAPIKWIGVVISGKPVYVNTIGPAVAPTGTLADNRSTEMITEARGQWMTRLYGTETKMQILPSASGIQIYVQFWT